MTETACTCHMYEIAACTDDAMLSRDLRKTMRACDCQLVRGCLEGEVGAEANWLADMADTQALPVVVAEERVGLRGLALLILADIAIIGPDASWTGSSCADLAELAAIRLGPLAARQLVFAPDPLASLVQIGHAERAAEPLALARTRCASLTRVTVQRVRKGWRAARDLSADEALGFGRWFTAAPLEEGF